MPRTAAYRENADESEDFAAVLDEPAVQQGEQGRRRQRIGKGGKPRMSDIQIANGETQFGAISCSLG